MIRILEGPLREVEKLANDMESEGWSPLGPAVPNGRNPVTNAQMVMVTMAQRPPMMRQITDKDVELALKQYPYSLNSVGGGDE